MSKLKLMKGLLGASALTVLSTGTAFAQNNFTAAETDVENTFTLNYNVGTVAQPEICTSDDIGCSDTPTVFAVDRLVNVTVAASSPTTTVAPTQTDAILTYTVVNNGNDTHAYFLETEVVGTNGAPLLADNFDSVTPTSGQAVIQVSTDGITFTDYDPANPPVLAPDAVLTVRVLQDIPSGVTDEQRAEIILIADTRDETAPFAATVNDAGGINDPLVTENVLADLDGPADNASDDLEDGAHSALSAYLVAAAEISAVKTVHAVPDDHCTGGSDLAASGPGAYIPPTADDTLYFIPGACIEYRITVSNDGTEAGVAIELEDYIQNDMQFVDAKMYGFSAGSIPATSPTADYTGAGAVCVNPGSACEVEVNAAVLDGKATPAATATTATLVIRMLIP